MISYHALRFLAAERQRTRHAEAEANHRARQALAHTAPGDGAART
jgi:hypothetical protein